VKVWRLLPFHEEDPFCNMATDEAIFRESLHSKTFPTLRLYGWRRPAVSIGYFQSATAEVDLDACRSRNIAIVRRPTGGRAIFHDEELTYSVVSGSALSCFPLSVTGTYRVIMACIARGLGSFAIQTDMAGTNSSRDNNILPACCFSMPSRYELLAGRKKICGSAQFRSRDGFLQHGSLLWAFDPCKTWDLLLPHLKREEQIAGLRASVTSVKEAGGGFMNFNELVNAIILGFQDVLGIEFAEGRLTPGEENLRDRLLAEKYQTDRWNIEGRVTKHGL
jgi:lipoate-protein ligase A